MTTMIKEVYEALKDAGANEEKAISAAQAIADYEKDISSIKYDLKLLKWMIALVITIEVLPLLKTMFA